MTLITLSSILLSVMLSVLAQIFLKQGMMSLPREVEGYMALSYTILTNKFVLLGLFCYGMSMVVWLYVLSKVEVSRAYPFVGLGFIGTMLFAHYFLGEELTGPKIVGTLLIVSGVIVLAK